jgi:hypothetical protein
LWYRRWDSACNRSFEYKRRRCSADSGHSDQPASDATALSTALQLQFANWDEVGFTTNIQNWILANVALYTTATPTTAELQAGYQQLVNIGVNATYSQYVNSILSQTLAVRQSFISLVQTKGLKNVHSMIVAELTNYAKTAEKVDSRNHLTYSSAHLKNACEDLLDSRTARGEHYGFHNTGLVLVGNGPPWLTIAGLYLGIVALAVSGPVGWGIAAAGLAIGGAGLMSGC